METKTKRNANIELLRIISMLMIIMLHALGKGNNLGEYVSGLTVNKTIAWMFESLSISAVNIFVLISGYFLVNSEFKMRRLIELVCECLFYTVGTFAVTALLGIDNGFSISVYNLLHIFLPIHMNVYWFMTAYIVLYMLLPIISKGIRAISEKDLRVVIILLLAYECLFKSILPFRLSVDVAGYSFFWILTVFMIGSYIRLYGNRIVKSARVGFFIYVASCILIFSESFVIGYIIDRYGRLKELKMVAMDYNHIFVLSAAVGLFSAFLQLKQIGTKAGNIICRLSPMALGVYLFHENMSLRYAWPKWFGVYESVYLPMPMFIAKLLLGVVTMYALGTAIDFVRIKLFGLVGNKK